MRIAAWFKCSLSKLTENGSSLNNSANDLCFFFDRFVNVERIKVGKRQTIDTLISEEALLFAKYLRHERKDWVPRIVNFPHYSS